MRKVRVISREGEAVLVEWTDDDGHYRRGVLPPEAVVKGHCKDEELDQSIIYGERWSSWIVLPTPEEIEQELYRHGLWTFDDILANGEVVRGVTMKPFESILVRLLRLASGKGG